MCSIAGLSLHLAHFSRLIANAWLLEFPQGAQSGRDRAEWADSEPRHDRRKAPACTRFDPLGGNPMQDGLELPSARRAKHYRVLAEGARRNAIEATCAAAQTSFGMLAAQWDKLAADIEAAASWSGS
jgi:hypothetical protein